MKEQSKKKKIIEAIEPDDDVIDYHVVSSIIVSSCI